MDHKKRIEKLEQQTGGQVETEIKIMPEGQDPECYKFIDGEKIRISAAEYNQHITRQVKAGPVNIDVKLPDSWKGFNGEL